MHSLHRIAPQRPDEEEAWDGTRRLPHLAGLFCPVVGCDFAQAGTLSFEKQAKLEAHMMLQHPEDRENVTEATKVGHQGQPKQKRKRNRRR